MDDKITIDKETLKAIASDTRLDILKQLDRKKQTLSDLSKALKLSSPTIKEHLDVLSKAGLVRKEVSFRKWKYYSLTFKGKGILRPNETKLFLTLLITIVFGIGVFVILGLFTSVGSVASRASTQQNYANSVKSMATSSVDNSIVVAEDSINTVSGQVVVETQTADQNITKPFFNLSYLILATVILIIFLAIVWYINTKQKNK